MASGAQAIESRRASVIEKLKNANLPVYTKESFAASDVILPGSGRATLTHGTLRIQQNVERHQDVPSVVVVKSLKSAYAYHRTKDEAEDQKYRSKLFSYFEREADIWLRARFHPNITSVCGFIPSYGKDNLPALIFPYHPLENLRMYVSRRDTPLNDKSKLLLLRNVACGLKYCEWTKYGVLEMLMIGSVHGLQDPIVHRDLSGKLLDPTLSVVINSTRNTKYEWQPPEFVKAATYLKSYTNPEPSSDIWSFACVVLEILTECDPWPPSADVFVELQNDNHPPYPNKQFEKKYKGFLDGCWGFRSWPKLRYTAEKAILKIDDLINAEC